MPCRQYERNLKDLKTDVSLVSVANLLTTRAHELQCALRLRKKQIASQPAGEGLEETAHQQTPLFCVVLCSFTGRESGSVHQ